MRTPLAWNKMTHNKVRTAASLSGVCFAIVLIFMQLGFYDASFRSSTMVYDQMDFDIALVSPHYYLLLTADNFPRRRLQQARAVPGVAQVAPLYVVSALLRNPTSDGKPRTPSNETALKQVLVIGVDPAQQPFREPRLAQCVKERLKKLNTVIWDIKTQPGYARLHEGAVIEVGSRNLEVVGTSAHGCGFVSPAMMIVGSQTLPGMFGNYPLDDVSVGLVKLAPGANRPAVLAALRKALPPDTLVWDRTELESNEQHYFMFRKPLGIMFGSGVILAFLVGAVILYQILASEVLNYLKQYATLIAMGYSRVYVNWVVFQQATLFAVFGYVPAAIFGWGIYVTTRLAVNLPMFMTPGRLAFVLFLAIIMCSGSGLLVLRQLRRADPADLFA
jgi:putative ABC transport system permease protein